MNISMGISIDEVRHKLAEREWQFPAGMKHDDCVRIATNAEFWLQNHAREIALMLLDENARRTELKREYDALLSAQKKDSSNDC